MFFPRAPLTQTNSSPITLQDPVFIADLHLSVAVPTLRSAFAAFMRAFDSHPALINRQELVILGDFFDAWLGDDTRGDYEDVLSSLTHFVKTPNARGETRRLFLMHGNRDFLVGTGFTKAVGATLLADPVVADIQGIKTLISHGDMWCTADARYQTVRARLRRPFIQFALLSLPLFIRRRVAENARAKSQSVKAQVVERTILDVTPEAVLKDALRYQTGLVIHGHTHRPGTHPLSETPVQFTPGEPKSCGTRWVLGDWVYQQEALIKGTALVFNAGSPTALEVKDLIATH